MKLSELKTKIKTDPISLFDLFYVVSYTPSGITLQAEFGKMNGLPTEIIEILIFNNKNKWLEGRFNDEDILVDIVLT